MLTKSFYIFTFAYLAIIVLTAILAYYLERRKAVEKGYDITIGEFLNNYTKVTPKVILVGLVFGIVFGMMDNISLYFGIEGFGDTLKEKYNMSEFEVAGYGNTYSGALGITLATFATLVSSYLFPDVDQNSLPVWLNTTGYIIGALIGIYIPKLFFPKNKIMDK